MAVALATVMVALIASVGTGTTAAGAQGAGSPPVIVRGLSLIHI